MTELKRFWSKNHPTLLTKTDENVDKFWGEWLRRKGLLGGGDVEAKKGSGSVNNGWTAPDEDLSDTEDDGWTTGGTGGLKRPGEKDSEEYSSEEAMEDEWNDDSDDDDHGGQMMPIPNL